MRLRPRMMLCFVAMTLLLVATQHQLLSTLLLKSFTDLERQDAREDVERAARAFEQLSSDLHLKTVDWSDWDDTYRFMADHNAAYVKSNLVESSIATMKLDLILYLDARRRLFHALPVRRQKGARPPEPGRVVRDLAALPSAASRFEQPEGFHGVLDQPDRPLLVSLRPIRTSAGKGPARGWLLFGRWFDDAQRSDLAERMRMDTLFRRIGSPRMPSDGRQALRHLARPAAIWTRPLSGSDIAGYTLVRDIGGRPLMLLRVRQPRDIYRQGVHATQFLARMVMLVAVVFSLLAGLLVEYYVLSRLSRLSAQVRRVGREGNPDARVHLSGRDELAWLAEQINAGLGRLQESEEQLRAYSQTLEQRVEERTRQIEHQALHDALTELPNRTLFMDRLAHARARATRSGQGLAVLFVDLDNFKLINDSQGHEAGDHLLIAVAERLQQCVRPADTVARLGGDEFTLLLEDLPTRQEAVRVAQRILASLQAHIRLPQREVFISASIGIAFSINADEEPEVLLRNADTAMYQAKASGKGGYAVFEQSMNDRVVERMEMETGLRRALDNGELRVFYQPLLDMQTGLLTAVEALVRWEHPTRGLVAPGKFIPIAEETGLILPIGCWVLEEACRHTKAWQERYPHEPPLCVNVNLSVRQLQDAGVVDQVAGVLQRTGLPPACLKLEITESMLVSNVEETIARLKGLKALGVKLAIDDFGTGYSSISLLSAFPVDTVKIDRAFVQRLAEQPEAESVVAAIIGLCRSMHLDVTGEGVETAEQVAQLQALGCDMAQGYYFARPMPEPMLRQHLQQGHDVFVRMARASANGDGPVGSLSALQAMPQVPAA